MREPLSPELARIFRRFEPLPERIERNRRRLRAYLILFVTLSSFLVALSLVMGSYLTLLLFALRMRIDGLLDALWWFTVNLPMVIALSWAGIVPLFTIWCARTVRAGEIGVLSALKAVPVPTGEMGTVKSALHDAVIASGLKMPRLAVIDDDAVNAFVVAHDQSTGWIGVTAGLARRLDVDELRCVLAHLVARLQDGSARTSTVLAELFAGASGVATAGDHLLDMCTEEPDDGVFESTAKTIVTPVMIFYSITRWCLSISALVIQRGYRRHQALTAEYADSMGMLLTRDPGGMMGALEKVLPADNRPGTVWDVRFREDIFGALFFAWPTYSFHDDPELVRIRRMREVLGPAAIGESGVS